MAITEQIDSRQSELTPEAAADEIATFLLQEQYRVHVETVHFCINFIMQLLSLVHSQSFRMGLDNGIRPTTPPFLPALMATCPAHNHG